MIKQQGTYDISEDYVNPSVVGALYLRNQAPEFTAEFVKDYIQSCEQQGFNVEVHYTDENEVVRSATVYNRETKVCELHADFNIALSELEWDQEGERRHGL